MSDSHSVTTTTSWGSRLGNSFKGILLGILMFLASFPLLWWNEGRTQGEHLALLEGAAIVVSVPSSKLDPAKEGQLIHTSGTVKTDETLQDDEFGIAMPGALQLRREVEMYQWKETSSSSSEKNLGGSETTTTTYNYTKEWSPGLISSGNFHKADGHQNPASMDYQASTQVAEAAQMGAFHIRPQEIKSLNNFQGIDLEGLLFNKIQRSYQVMGDHIYLGEDPQTPQIGDMRIRFSFVPETLASIVAKQDGETLTPYKTKAGKSLLLMQSGEASAETMFEAAQSANTMMAWILRLVGFLLMLGGLRTLLAPLSVLGDIVPLVGDIIGAGTGLIAFIIALPLTLITIALAWVFYRPLLAIGLGIIAAASLGFGWHLKRKKAAGASLTTPGAATTVQR